MSRAAQIARSLFDTLAARTADAPGVTRVAYGEGERIAFALMAEAAREWGANAVFDAAGNQFIVMPGADRSRTILVGSHLDSVPHGGNYDGAAGVILGLCLQALLAERGETPPFDLAVACLRAEESCWFPHSYIGSKTALGLLDPQVLDEVRRSDTGRTLAEHMREEGFDPDAVRQGKHLFDRSRIAAYIEPHIEQAPLLIEEGLPLGIVTGIRGSFRYREMRIFGEYAHSGAMPRRLRRDAAVAGARLVGAMQDYWEHAESRGDDLTVTFGQVFTDPQHHSFSKVAGELSLCLDVRSENSKALERARQALHDAMSRIGGETGVEFVSGPLSGSEPALMSPGICSLLEESCRHTGTAVRRMASGAGHDAATFALAGVPSAMIFIRNANGSHNPDEHMDMSDFDSALDVLYAAMRAPAERWSSQSPSGAGE
jgi:N-carbamoyl-L-amino-acid hydrolase